MTSFPTPDEERLAELLRALPPAPEAWVRAAQELPFARRGLDDLLTRIESDTAFREALVADLEATLALEGVEPDEATRRALLERLRADGGEPPPAEPR